MSISNILLPDKNNITLTRLILACMVIVGHTYVLNPVGSHIDIISAVEPFDDFGSFAVKIFFFLSGLLVVNSLQNRKNSFHYWSHRFLRIFPALIIILVISAFIIGPIFTKLNIHSYFNDKATYRYVYKNIILITKYNLPGVFENNKYANAVNGSLWSLSWEFKCYIITYLIYLISFKKYFKWVGTILFSILAIQVIYFRYFLSYDLTWNPHYPFYYCLGAIIALHADKIKLDFRILGLMFALMVLGYFIGFPYNTVFFISFFCLFLLWLSTTKLSLKFKLENDISYGVYLWGFIVQQCINACFPDLGFFTYMLVALSLSIVMGAISWFLIEKPSMKFAKKISKSPLAKSFSF